MKEMNLPAVTAIVVAAGASRRMGFDKLSFRLPDGRTVLQTSCDALAAHPAVTGLVLVCGGNHCGPLHEALHGRAGRCDPRRQCAQRPCCGRGGVGCHP